MSNKKKRKSENLKKKAKPVKSSKKKAGKNQSKTKKDYKAACEECLKKNKALKLQLRDANKKNKKLEKVYLKLKKQINSAKKKPAPKKQTIAKTAPSKTKVVAKVKDNLKQIDGIGPAIEKHLLSAGINSFSILGKTPAKKIKEILQERGGSRYNQHDPASWGRQAKLAAAGKMEQLKALQAKLKSGK